MLGPDEKGLRFCLDVLQPAQAISAIGPTGELLAVAGFKTDGTGFLDGDFSAVRRHYGIFSALWRTSFLLLLERQEKPGNLQMDGICVAAEARGQGLGTALLTALAARAQQTGHQTMSLDVIDINPRARALYERMGFEPVKTETLGPLRYIFGFRSATRMELDLTREPNPKRPPV